MRVSTLAVALPIEHLQHLCLCKKSCIWHFLNLSKSCQQSAHHVNISKSRLLHAATMRVGCKPGTQPERLWNLVKNEAPQLSKLALHLMGVSVNAAGCERSFSQMGLTHTKLRN